MYLTERARGKLSKETEREGRTTKKTAFPFFQFFFWRFFWQFFFIQNLSFGVELEQQRQIPIASSWRGAGALCSWGERLLGIGHTPSVHLCATIRPTNGELRGRRGNMRGWRWRVHVNVRVRR